MNRVDISHGDVRCTITTPSPLPAEAWPLLESLGRIVAATAMGLAALSGPTEEDTHDDQP